MLSSSGSGAAAVGACSRQRAADTGAGPRACENSWEWTAEAIQGQCLGWRVRAHPSRSSPGSSSITHTYLLTWTWQDEWRLAGRE